MNSSAYGKRIETKHEFSSHDNVPQELLLLDIKLMTQISFICEHKEKISQHKSL